MKFHSPVLLNETIEGLNINPEGVYVDATFGGGGHTSYILKKISKGRVYAFDQDKDAHANKINDNRLKLIHANFRYLKNFLRYNGVEKIDGIIADLGVSSYQFDNYKRGFSTRYNSKIDMRMNINSDLDAKQILNTYSQNEIADLLFCYGDFKNSRKIAEKIVKERDIQTITHTDQFSEILKDFYIEKNKNKFLARVFQSLRIEVNDEINALKELLTSSSILLKSQGRLVVLSYHSIEDRIVKNFINKGTLDGSIVKDFFGNQIKSFNAINKKAIVAQKDEIKKNPRSRSVRLRIAEKI